MQFARKLPLPSEIKTTYPLTDKMQKIHDERDMMIKSVFDGTSDRFILIIGPCSADSREPVMEYLSFLAKINDEVNDKILIIPRLYTTKPRTTGDGYKGMLHRPDPKERPDMLKGIVSIRELHCEALRDYGFTCADEMLYPENYRYLSDILAYVAVGARSVENQQHRLVASGVEVPVGMKNPTSGDLSVMFNAITASRHSHTFLYRGWEVHSSGNEYSHAILRGYTNREGGFVSNYGYDSLLKTYEMFTGRGLTNPSVIVDCNHANSGKDFRLQPEIAMDVLSSKAKDSDMKSFIKGLMIESYIEEGCAKEGRQLFGQSITDSCLGMKDTEELIYRIREQL